MSLYMRRIKDDVTQIRTNNNYIIDVLNQCKFASFVKTSRMGTTFLVNKDLDEIPENNAYVLCEYFRKEGGIKE